MVQIGSPICFGVIPQTILAHYQPGCIHSFWLPLLCGLLLPFLASRLLQHLYR